MVIKCDWFKVMGFQNEPVIIIQTYYVHLRTLEYIRTQFFIILYYKIGYSNVKRTGDSYYLYLFDKIVKLKDKGQLIWTKASHEKY